MILHMQECKKIKSQSLYMFPINHHHAVLQHNTRYALFGTVFGLQPREMASVINGRKVVEHVHHARDTTIKPHSSPQTNGHTEGVKSHAERISIRTDRLSALPRGSATTRRRIVSTCSSHCSETPPQPRDYCDRGTRLGLPETSHALATK